MRTPMFIGVVAPLVVAHGAVQDAIEYCPDTAEDFQEEVEGPPGQVTWTSRGWHIQGQRRVSSKASFDLAGGYIDWDMDLSNAHGGVNTNFYVTFPHQPNCGKDCYCDSGATGGCAEIDFTENNGGCYQATTWHEDASGGDKSGHGGSGGISGGTVHMRASYSADGSALNIQIGGNSYSGHGLADQMSQYGAVVYSSQWVGWVPGDCGGDGNLQASSYSVSNVKIKGKVVQGPVPKVCGGPSPPTTTPAPSPGGTCSQQNGNNKGDNLMSSALQASGAAQCCDFCKEHAGCVGYTYIGANGECWLKSRVDPITADAYAVSGSYSAPHTTPAPSPHTTTPSPTPAGGCTGGDLASCIHACPEQGYEACCVACGKACECPGGSLAACIHQCPSGDEFQPCVQDCQAKCESTLV